MKSLIVYYSYTGNTANVAIALSNLLKEKGTVQIISLEAQDEAKDFFSKCKRAFLKKRAKINEVTFDVSNFDLVLVGSPVWAFAPAPAVTAYLDKISGLNGKEAVAFVTYGSGLGKKRALNFINNSLKEKGAVSVKNFSVSQLKSRESKYIKETVSNIL